MTSNNRDRDEQQQGDPTWLQWNQQCQCSSSGCQCITAVGALAEGPGGAGESPLLLDLRLVVAGTAPLHAAASESTGREAECGGGITATPPRAAAATAASSLRRVLLLLRQRRDRRRKPEVEWGGVEVGNVTVAAASPRTVEAVLRRVLLLQLCRSDRSGGDFFGWWGVGRY